MLRVLVLLATVTLCLGASLVESNNRNGRIVGGWPAWPEFFPYQVAVKDASTGAHLCGGFIINERWIGSSAYCTIDRTAQETVILAGTTQLNSGGQSYAVQEIINHENYIPILKLNEVSALRTVTQIIYSGAVQPIALSPQFIGGGLNVRAAGWGAIDGVNQEYTNDLHYVTLQTLTNADCRSRLIAAGRPAELIFDDTICTFNSPEQGICRGDNGGAIALNNQVIGVISWNIECARGYPDMHVRMSTVRSWFLSNTLI